jgi:hypothetical protein
MGDPSDGAIYVVARSMAQPIKFLSAHSMKQQTEESI